MSTTDMIPTTGAAATQIAKRDPGTVAPRGAGIELTSRGLQLRTLDDAYRFAKYVVESQMAPSFKTAEAVLVALQFGAEAGLSPMASLRSVVVIKGRPGWETKAALAIVRQSGQLAFYDERIEGQGDAMAGVVELERVGCPRKIERFTVAQAKQAGLWGRKGRDGEPTPWVTYPERMLKARARGFALGDNFGDVLLNLRTREELEDMPDERTVGERDVTPAPARVAPPGPDPLLAEVLEPGTVEADDPTRVGLPAVEAPEDAEVVRQRELAQAAAHTGSLFDEPAAPQQPAARMRR